MVVLLKCSSLKCSSSRLESPWSSSKLENPTMSVKNRQMSVIKTVAPKSTIKQKVKYTDQQDKLNQSKKNSTNLLKRKMYDYVRI